MAVRFQAWPNRLVNGKVKNVINFKFAVVKKWLKYFYLCQG